MYNFFWVIKFILFNKKNYKKKENANIVLVELFNYKASIISNGIFASELSKKFNAKIIGYEPNFSNIKKKIKIFLYKLNFFSHYNLYKSYGFSDLIIPKNNINLDRANAIFKKLKKKINSKKDILNIKIDNVLIGDLIYDSFLRENKFFTIDYKSKIFQDYLLYCIKLFLFWSDYFKYNKVKGLIVSHSVYLTAIPVRIACALKVQVFNVGFSSVYRLTQKKPLKFSYFSEYPKIFNNLTSKTKSKLLKISKKNLKLRLSGKKDLLYKESQPLSEKVYSNQNINVNKKIINNKKKILIAVHDFTDAPHVHGKMIFEDFFEWINFLGKKSLKFKDYEWILKLHPADHDENLQFVEFFLKKYPTLKLLKKNTSHNEILSAGVNCVLTTYGSIAHEYPLFGVPVINAGENPHSGYKFSIHPKSLKQYNYLINNITKIRKPYKFNNSIYEFYSMYNLVDYNLFEELEFSEKKLNSFFIFKYFFKKYDNMLMNKVKKKYSKFINSNNRRLIKH